MNTQQVLAAVRALLMALGGYFIGVNFLGLPIDAVLWQQIAGIAISVIAMVWSILTKSLAEEVWQGVVRQVITFAGGILLARGILTNEMWQSILAVLVAVLPFIQSNQQRSLANKLRSGKLTPNDLTE